MSALTQKTIRGSLLRWLLIPAWVLGLLGLVSSLLLHNLSHSEHLTRHSLDDLCHLGQLYSAETPLPKMLEQLELTSTLLARSGGHDTRFRFNTLPTLISLGGPPLPIPDDAEHVGKGSCQIRIHTSWDASGRLQIASLLMPAQDGSDKSLLIQSVRPFHPIDLRILDLGMQMALTTTATAILFSLIVFFGVRRGLRPLTSLVAAIRQLDSSQSGRIHVDHAPLEIRCIEDTLNEQLERISQQVQRERSFLNDAAHQLRTPIAGILNQSELALTEQDPARVRQRLEHIVQASERSAMLIHQLLALSRGYEAGSLGMVLFDLPELARKVALQWVGPAADIGIELSYEGEDNALYRGSPELLREALHNLLDNVLRHARACTEVVVSVHQTGAPDQRQLILEVRDNGQGLQESQLPYLFDRFWTGDESQGNGIGLALVQQIVQAHQGQVHAELGQPQGLTIRLLLPMNDSQPARRT